MKTPWYSIPSLIERVRGYAYWMVGIAAFLFAFGWFRRITGSHGTGILDAPQLLAWSKTAFIMAIVLFVAMFILRMFLAARNAVRT